MVAGGIGAPGRVADRGGAGGRPTVPAGTLAAVGDVLSLVRKAKSEAKVSMRADVSRVVVTATPEVLARVQGGVEDLQAAGRIAELELVASDGPGDASPSRWSSRPSPRRDPWLSHTSPTPARRLTGSPAAGGSRARQRAADGAGHVPARPDAYPGAPLVVRGGAELDRRAGVPHAATSLEPQPGAGRWIDELARHLLETGHRVAEVSGFRPARRRSRRVDSAHGTSTELVYGLRMLECVSCGRRRAYRVRATGS